MHHVILFEAAGDNAAEARRLNAASGGKGWTCFGGPGLTETRASAGNIASDRLGSPQWISAWVPGHTTNDLPQGTGVLLHKGAVVVMQVHYNLMHPMHGMRMDDRSRAVLRIVPAAGSQLTPLDTFLAPAPVELPCPAGVSLGSLLARRRLPGRSAQVRAGRRATSRSAFSIICNKTLADYPQQVGDAKDVSTSCDRTVNRPIRIYGVAGHMHLRGFDIRIELNPGTPRAQTLLHIPKWDFHWQDAYYLEQPVDAEPGDTIRVTCRFDNSRAAQPVVAGKRLAPRYVALGRRHDRRDVPRPAPGRDAVECCDDRVRAVLERLEHEDADERERGCRRPSASRQVARDDRPLPLRARRAADRLRGARDRRLARLLDDLARRRRRATSAAACSRSRPTRARSRRGAATSRTPGSRSGPSSSRATRTRRCRGSRTSSTSSSSTRRRTTTRRSSRRARDKVEPGALFVADNVLSHPDPLARYSAARQADPTLESSPSRSTAGLELSVVLALTVRAFGIV